MTRNVRDDDETTRPRKVGKAQGVCHEMADRLLELQATQASGNAHMKLKFCPSEV